MSTRPPDHDRPWHEPPQREPLERESLEREGSLRNQWLEKNLAALLGRAWRPVPIRAGFESAVLRRALAALPAPAVGSRVPSATTWRHGRTVRLAAGLAAASFLLAWVGTTLASSFLARTEFARDRLLARGELAVREGAGPWRAHAPGDTTPTFVLAEPARDDALALALPPDARAAVTCGDGALALLGPAAASFAPTGSGAEVRLDSAAGLSARGFSGVIAGAFGRLDATDADFDLVAPAEGEFRARLTAGLARWHDAQGTRHDLAQGTILGSGSIAFAPGSGATAGPALATGPGRVPLSPVPSATNSNPGSTNPGSPSPGSPNPGSGAAGNAPVLSGSVRDAQGRPVESFTLIVLPEVELPRTADPRVEPRQDAHGRFEIAAGLPERATVFVRADGFALWTREHVAFDAGPVSLDVVLASGAALAGRVVDARSGEPLAGAVVVSEADVPLSLLPLGRESCPENPQALTRTGADGRFRLEGLAAAPTVLRVEFPGRAPAWSARLVPGDPTGATPEGTLIALAPGGAVVGRVEREDGSPWAGAGIVVMPQLAVFDLPRKSYGIGLTDERGAYRIEDLPAGPCVVVRIDLAADSRAGRDRPGGTEVREARVSASAATQVDFLASVRGSRLSGRVLLADRSPLRDGTISIVARAEGADGASTGTVPDAWRSQLCDGEGAFEFTEVEPGTYEVYLGVRSPGDVVLVDLVEVRAATNVDRLVRVPAGELTGRVRRAGGGAPAGGAIVLIEREATGPDGTGREFAAKVLCDERGEWRAPWLAAASYRVRAIPLADRDGLAGAWREHVEVGADGRAPRIDFELEAGARLELLLRDASGLPLAGARARLCDERGTEIPGTEGVASDGAGVLSLAGLPAGRLSLRVRAPGGLHAEATLAARAGETASLELRLSP